MIISKELFIDIYHRLNLNPTNPLSLESIEKELKKINSNYTVISFLDFFYSEYENRFHIELLTFPSWATKYSAYKFNDNVYTHIRLKGSWIRD